MIKEFEVIQTKFIRLKTALESNESKPGYAKEFYNSYNLINVLGDKISMQINQLNPLIYNRPKRGLLDGLGSIVKAITGNLDQSDAEKYDQAISTLSNNQVRLKTAVKEQITLLQKSIRIFENNTQILSHNQKVLESRIMQIEQVLKSAELGNAQVYEYFLIQMIISQINAAYQAIYDVLERIEVAITFAKLNTFHNSIADPKDLLEEVKTISGHLTKNKLPFEPILENILLFEKTLNIKSYSKKNQIIFILEVPIVENEIYNYYHLYSLPTPENTAFKIIVPQAKFLILNEQSYMFSNTKCQEVDKTEFICHEANPVKIHKEEEAPCEVQMLKFMKNVTTCQHIPTIIDSIKTQKLEGNQWILVVPGTTVAVQKCGINSDNVPLKGTYLLEINPYCEVWVKDIKIQNYQDNEKVFKPIILPKLINNHISTEKSTVNFKPLRIDSINLDEVKYIQGALELQNKNLNSISNVPIHFDNISVWTIIIYILIATVIIYGLYQLYQKKVKNVSKPQENQVENLPNIRPTNPVAIPRVLH